MRIACLKKLRSAASRAMSPGGGMVVLAVVVAIVAWLSVSRGHGWSVGFQPDEPTLARWMDRSVRNGYLSKRVYPTGWIQLYRGYLGIARLVGKAAAGVGEGQVQERAVLLDVDVGSAAVQETRHDAGGARLGLQPIVESGRDFNRWLFVLSAVLVFAAVLEWGGGWGGGTFAGVLFGLSPMGLEWAHYCETDMGLVFGLALSLWLAGRAWSNRRPRWRRMLDVAGFALGSGFAFSCKYTLFPLLVLPVVAAVAAGSGVGEGQTWREAWGRRLAAIGALVVACLAAELVGYLLGTPFLWKDFAGFCKSAHRIQATTYAEETRAVGHLVAAWWTEPVHRLFSLVQKGWVTGAGWRIWPLVSLGFWWAKPYRRGLAVVPLFCVLFVGWVAVGMPWIRTQEFLPLMVAGCVSAGLPVGWGLEKIARACRGGEKGWSLALAVVALAGSGIFLVEQARAGARMVSAFQRADSRVVAWHDLYRMGGAEATTGFDTYLERVGWGQPFERRKMMCLPFHAEIWSGMKAGTGEGLPFAYYLRNVRYEGRAVRRNLLTGELLPEVAESVETFGAMCAPLAAWRMAGGGVYPVFAQPDMELWAVPEGTGAGEPPVDVPVCLERPFLLDEGVENIFGGWQADAFGPQKAAKAIGKRTTLVPGMGGAAEVFLVAESVGAQGACRMAFDGPVDPRRVELTGNGGGAAVGTADGKALERLGGASLQPGIRFRVRGDERDGVHFVVATPDVARAAHLLRRAGNPGAALSLLAQKGAELDEAAQTEAFLAATEVGGSEAAKWRDAAMHTLAILEAALAGEGQPVRVRGTPWKAVCDFARIRQLLSPWEAREGFLPVVLVPGHYEMKVTVPAVLVAGRAPEEVGEDVEKAFALPCQLVATAPGEHGEVAATFRVDVEGNRPVRVALTEAALALASWPKRSLWATIEFMWSPRDFLEAAAEELKRALEAG